MRKSDNATQLPAAADDALLVVEFRAGHPLHLMSARVVGLSLLRLCYCCREFWVWSRVVCGGLVDHAVVYLMHISGEVSTAHTDGKFLITYTLLVLLPHRVCHTSQGCQSPARIKFTSPAPRGRCRKRHAGVPPRTGGRNQVASEPDLDGRPQVAEQLDDIPQWRWDTTNARSPTVYHPATHATQVDGSYKDPTAGVPSDSYTILQHLDQAHPSAAHNGGMVLCNQKTVGSNILCPRAALWWTALQRHGSSNHREPGSHPGSTVVLASCFLPDTFRTSMPVETI